MPKLRIWLGLVVLSVSPFGVSAQQQPAAPDAQIKAPEQPSAALLEFIGDWHEDERQLIGMETQAKNITRKQNPKEVRRAP